MTFGEVHLYDGLSLSAIAIGALALSSVLVEMLELRKSDGKDSFTLEQPRSGAKTALPFKEFFSYWRTILRSSLIGSFVGMLPGLGVTLAAFLSYGAARRSSPNRENFGKGEPEGIIATEAANSAVVGANLVPTIALGIPGNIATALLIGALVMHGIVPGPFMLQMHAELIYALFASMIIANFVHLIIGRAGVNLWVQFATVPRGIILPPVLLFCIVGVYLPAQSLWDVAFMLVFAGVGVLMHRTGFSIVCLVIGFLLGGMFETSLRQTLLLYNGRYIEIIQSPVAIGFALLTLGIMLRAFMKGKNLKAEASRHDSDDHLFGVPRETMERELRVEGATKRSALRTAFVWAINSGRLDAGRRLSSETALAKMLGVSLGTVQAALGQVQDLGLIARRRGDGTRILEGKGFGSEVWHFRMHDLNSGEPVRIFRQEFEILQTDAHGPWVEHLCDKPSYTMIRRSIEASADIRVGAEMVLDAALVTPQIASIGELRLANLRTVLEQRLKVRATRMTQRVLHEIIDRRTAALYAMPFDISTLRLESKTFMEDDRPFYFQTIHFPADRIALEF